MDCKNYNQYYSDVVVNGKIVNQRCFKGSEVYKNIKRFKINNYVDFDSEKYYQWINDSFNQYAFPDEKFNEAGYNPEAVYNNICNPVDYSLKPQQKFAGRIINTNVNNRGLLIYHGLGSGKTQTSIVIGEAFKFRNVDESIIQGREDTRVFIVVPAALVDQYYNEIIGQFENGKIKSATGQILINGERQYYLDEIVRESIKQAYLNIKELEDDIKLEIDVNENKRKKRALLVSIQRLENEERNKINKVYEIISHESFLNRIFKFQDNDFVPGPYLPLLNKPNGLMIIDEVQNLVSAMGTSYRKLLYAIKFYTNKNFKIVCLTGTPIYDKPYEFGLLMNLLRPRMLFPDGYEDFNQVFLEDNTRFINRDLFKQMCAGYVSYFKGGNPEAYPYKKTTIMLHTMGVYQYSQYKNALYDEVDRDRKKRDHDKPGEEFIVKIATTEKDDDQVAASGIFNNSNLLCNIAFPEAKLTVEESKRISRDSVLQANLREFKTVLTASKRKYSGSPENIQLAGILSTVKVFSEKFSKVAELILQSEGPVFVYSNYVYYGVDAMSTIMNFLGYDAYPNKGPRGSYFVWKGKAKPEEIPKAKELFNSKENKDGSLLKIMFGTQTVMEGVDFKNVRQIHILDPWWNDSRMQQIIARGIRLCSHKDLPPNKRIVDVFIHLSELGSSESLYSLTIKRPDATGLKEIEAKVYSNLILENPDQKDSRYWVFKESFIKALPNSSGVTIYQTSSTFLANQIVPNTIKKLADPELTKLIASYKNLDSISVQQYMYNKALTKLKLNRQFESAIKEVAIDCNLNKNGNIVRLDEYYIPAGNQKYTLHYENYQTGERYVRLDTPSLYTIDDILGNVAKNSGKYRFRNMDTSEVRSINTSLIVPENINCGVPKYSFNTEHIPPEIISMSINKEFIPILMSMKLKDIKNYFYRVQKNQVPSADPKLSKKLTMFLSKDEKTQKEKIIEIFVDMGIGEREAWELYPLDLLKKEYARFKFNN
jgi:superfamily II DNA or RNA helicase